MLTRLSSSEIAGALRASSDTVDGALANALPHVVWTCDASGELEWINDRWFELTGMPEDAPLDSTKTLAFVHPDDHDTLKQLWGHALATSTPIECEYRIRNRAGEYRWHVARITPVSDSEGRVARWVAAAFDISDRRAAEEALRASERRFETIFHLSPQPSAITRVSDGVFLGVNNAFVETLGYSREEAVGQTALTLGMWTAEEREAFGVLLAEHSQRSAEATFRTKQGRVLRLELAMARVELGGEPCFVCVGTDVTDRLAKEDALRRSEAHARARADDLAALMDAVPAVVWISNDPECRELRGNRAGYEVLRMSMDQNLSKGAPDPAPTRHFSVFVNGSEVSAHQLPLQRAAHGEEFRNYEEEIRFDDGSVTHLFGTAVPLRDPDGTPRGAIGAFLDVTRLKEIEEALRRADRRKDEFLALLSHELRNPLMPILTAAHLLERHADPDARHDIDVIVRQVKHLVRLVDDLLDMSRVARGAMRLTKTRLELACLVERAAEATWPLFEEQGHQLAISVPVDGLAIEGDEIRLTQVIDNLLSNAARYTPPGGSITVTGMQEHDSVVLRVRDTGIGIEPSLLPHMFDVFVQGRRGPDRAPGGLGIGLSLVRQLTELHGGTVTAQSDGPGRGSEFVVRLPAAAARRESPAGVAERDAVQPKSSTPKAPVLIVDDHRDVVNGLARVLKISGFDVRAAASPGEALAIVDHFRPEIAILDIGLPEMDGYALAGELRSRFRDAPPALVALSGYSETEDKQRSDAAGFALHLVKPVDVNALVAALDLLRARSPVSRP